MKEIQTCFKVEQQFAEYFNGKRFDQLDFISQDLFLALFPDIKGHHIIRSDKYYTNAKVDIWVEVNGYIRGISIKTGHNNSVHLEYIESFAAYLKAIGFKNSNYLKRYLYGDGTDNNTGKHRLSAVEYKRYHRSEVLEVAKEIEDYRYPLLRRFIFDYHPSEKIKVDAVIWGTINGYLYATKKELMTYLMMQKRLNSSIVAISQLYIQNWNRNLKRNPKYEDQRLFMQVKWLDVEADLLKITAHRMLLLQKQQRRKNERYQYYY